MSMPTNQDRTNNGIGRCGFIILLALLVALYVVVVVGFNQVARGQDELERKLPMAKNFDVVSSFLQHTDSQGAISTDGKELRSYGVVIAVWKKDEILMPNSSVYHSVTTTKHRNLVRSMALEKGINIKEVN